jgi:hypothetical protein
LLDKYRFVPNQWRKDRALAEFLFGKAKLLEDTCHSQDRFQLFT